MSSLNESYICEIPAGMYCYTIIEVITKNDKIILKTKNCPYLVHLENGEYKCLYMNINSNEDFLLGDLCKICGVNDFDTDFEFGKERND